MTDAAPAAHVAVAADLDLTALVRAAGGDPASAAYVEGVLHVAGVTQAKLDKALKDYDPSKMKPAVPESVTAAQARIALLRAKHLDMVQTAVDADPETKIWFEYATVWERQNPYVVSLGDKLLGGSDVVDGLFIAAGRISA